MKQRVFDSAEAIGVLEAELSLAARRAVEKLRQVVDGPALQALASIKFLPIGRDPLDPERELNLVEQVNQTFTCLATVKGLEFLFTAHTSDAPFRANFSTAPGSDIESTNGRIAAEVFAAVRPSNNRKLARDIEKVRATSAEVKYVFFFSPGDHEQRLIDGVHVIPVRIVDAGFT